MKRLLLATMVVFLATSTLSAKKTTSDAERLCKVFTKKVEDYKKNMRHDKYAEVTLDSYKKRAKLFCAKAK